ncbi:Ig-like domain repeat protein [Nocardioides sp. C4-1]|uniref:Ig-like domain repeat protein n=1 Tax=Nocardioides sp. C4-1 TaxID=3151851 RepID=UPI003262FB4B
MSPTSQRPVRRGRRLLASGLAAALGVGVMATMATASAAAVPAGDEPGVTMRVYKVRAGLTSICTLKPAQTPNVDKLMQNINWTSDADFSSAQDPMQDNFIAHALANLSIDADGSYEFQLTSDDGSRLFIDDKQVINNDGLHGAEAKTGSVTLAAGVHKLRVEFLEATGGQELTLRWKKPGQTAFSLVGNDVLSTQAGVTRVVAPGTKECEGAYDAPGDGLPLDGVNPGYTLTNLREASWQPKVTGMAWDGDDLILTTWGGTGSPTNQTSEGELFRLKGVTTATSPAGVTRTLLASGLREPQGVAVVDTNDDGKNEIFVAEKHQISKFEVGTNGQLAPKTALWQVPTSGNFHEFAFGLLHRDNKFILNTSVSIDYGGATTNPQMAPLLPDGRQARGNSITVDDTTGAMEIVAGGLRTPNGIGFGPDNGVFVTDNQGGWLPASTLVQVKQGANFGHRTNPAGPFQSAPVSKPVLWMPQNEIANSPSTPVMLKSGPFAGQLMIGDVTYGGLQRAFLEKVDGEFQGALFRGTQGLEAGVNEVLGGPGDILITGGIGGGGNWEQAGKLTYGLQKLTPNANTPFEMKSMEVVEGGFKITYTEPLAAATLTDLASKYSVEQWGYRRTAAYGGPKIDQETLTVTSATPSADGTSVTLALDGLKPDRVVHLRSPRPFAAASSKVLYNTEAWYTLNTLPGYVAPPAPPAIPGLYELEDQSLLGTANPQTEHAGYSGSGFVAGFDKQGAGVSTSVTATVTGEHEIALRYANGPNPFQGPKKITMVVNDIKQQITLPSTGTWKTWGVHRFKLDLQQGLNSIVLRYDAGDDGNVNLDMMKIVPEGGTIYEAEDGELENGAKADTEHAGYTGSGFMGGTWNQGASTTLKVHAAETGDHPTTIRFANGPNPQPNQTKNMTVTVGDTSQRVAFPPGGSWKTWLTKDVVLPLQQGENTVKVAYAAGDEGNVNIDHLAVRMPGALDCGTTPIAPNDTFDGTKLDRCRWNVVNEVAAGHRLNNGKLEINARPGDLSGGTTSAENLVLQKTPQADNTWTAETTVAVDGTDDYIQSGLVAYGDPQNYGKLVVMNHPQNGWVVELGKITGGGLAYSPIQKLPVGANKTGVRLKLISDGFALRGQYSVDAGATWVNVGAQPAGSTFGLSGIGRPMLGLAAYNGTGTEIATFDDFAVTDTQLAPDTCTPTPADAGYKVLYDGTRADLTDGWTMAGPGEMVHQPSTAGNVACSMLTSGGFGLLWHTDPIDYDYSLTLDWMKPGNGNSGIFVGFPDPKGGTQGPIDLGHEIQIDATDADNKTTGAIYNFQGADKTARDAALKPDGQWNSYDIVVEGNRIRVYLNDVLINDFTNTDPNRMKKPSFVGLQTHGSAEDQVYFRNVQLKNLDAVDPEPVASTTTVTANPSSVQVGQTSTVTVDVKATGATPSGSVTLTDNGQAVGSAVALVDGKATFQVGPYTTAGNRAFVATYAGSTTVAGSTGNGALTVTAAPDPEPVASTTTVTANPSSVQVGQASTVTVDVKATGATPSGSVTLTDNGQAVGSAVALVDGKATFQVGPYTTAGNRAFVATYAGSTTVAGSTGNGALTVTAAPDPEPVASTTTVTANPSSVQVGQTSTITVDVKATGATPTGSVMLTDNGQPAGAADLVDGKATFTAGPYDTAGSHDFVATFEGSTTVAGSTGNGSLTVTAVPTPQPVASTVTAKVAPASVQVGKRATVQVTVTAEGATPTGQVVVRDGAWVIGTGMLTPAGKVVVKTDPMMTVGNQTLSISYAGDSAVQPGSTTVQVTVTAKPKPKPSLTVKPAKVDAGKNRRFGAVQVTCKPAGARCVGTVRLWSGNRSLGIANYAVSGGKSATVQLKLSNRARTLLAQRPRVQGKLVVAVDGGGKSTMKVTLTR